MPPRKRWRGGGEAELMAQTGRMTDGIAAAAFQPRDRHPMLYDSSSDEEAELINYRDLKTPWQLRHLRLPMMEFSRLVQPRWLASKDFDCDSVHLVAAYAGDDPAMAMALAKRQCQCIDRRRWMRHGNTASSLKTYSIKSTHCPVTTAREIKKSKTNQCSLEDEQHDSCKGTLSMQHPSENLRPMVSQSQESGLPACDNSSDDRHDSVTGGSKSMATPTAVQTAVPHGVQSLHAHSKLDELDHAQDSGESVVHSPAEVPALIPLDAPIPSMQTRTQAGLDAKQDDVNRHLPPDCIYCNKHSADRDTAPHVHGGSLIPPSQHDIIYPWSSSSDKASLRGSVLPHESDCPRDHSVKSTRAVKKFVSEVDGVGEHCKRAIVKRRRRKRGARAYTGYEDYVSTPSTVPTSAAVTTAVFNSQCKQQLKVAAIQPSQSQHTATKKTKRQRKRKRPRGRAPNGKRWCVYRGWVDLDTPEYKPVPNAKHSVNELCKLRNDDAPFSMNVDPMSDQNPSMRSLHLNGKLAAPSESAATPVVEASGSETVNNFNSTTKTGSLAQPYKNDSVAATIDTGRRDRLSDANVTTKPASAGDGIAHGKPHAASSPTAFAVTSAYMPSNNAATAEPNITGKGSMETSQDNQVLHQRADEKETDASMAATAAAVAKIRQDFMSQFLAEKKSRSDSQEILTKRRPVANPRYPQHGQHRPRQNTCRKCGFFPKRGHVCTAKKGTTTGAATLKTTPTQAGALPTALQTAFSDSAAHTTELVANLSASNTPEPNQGKRKTFTCHFSWCGAQYKSASGLYYHLRTFHADSNTR